MKRLSLFSLLVILLATVSVMFIPEKWATTVPELSSYLLAGIWIILFATGRQTPRFTPVLAPLGAILLLICLQIVSGITVYRWSTELALLYWLSNVAIFFCGLQSFSSSSLLGTFLRNVLRLGCAITVFSVVQALTSLGKVYWFWPVDPEIGNIFGPFLYRNQFAAFLELLIPIGLYLSITDRKRRIPFIAITAVLYGAVLASGSRSGFVLATVELILVTLLAARRGDLSRKTLINGALVLVALLLWLSIPAGPERLISKLGHGDPFAGRREFTESSLEMIKARPLAGFGLWNWPTVYPGYALFDDGKFVNQAHNDWAQWTVEGGIPLLLIMASIALWSLRRGLRTGWGLGVPIVFIHCFFDYPIQRPGVAVLFFLIMAAMAADSSNRQLESVED